MAAHHHDMYVRGVRKVGYELLSRIVGARAGRITLCDAATKSPSHLADDALRRIEEKLRNDCDRSVSGRGSGLDDADARKRSRVVRQVDR